MSSEISNESVYQTTVSSVEEWGKLESSQSTGRLELDPTSQLRAPVFGVQLARGQDLTRHGSDFPTSAASLSLGDEHDFELGS